MDVCTRVRRHDPSFTDRVRFAFHVGHLPPSFLHDQHASRMIPWVEVDLKIPCQSSTGHPREHDRSAPEEPQSPDVGGHGGTSSHHRVQIGRIGRRSRCDDCVCRFLLSTDFNFLPIAERPPPFLCVVEFIMVRIVEYACNHLATLHNRQGDPGKQLSVDKIDCPVYRIAYPQELVSFLACLQFFLECFDRCIPPWRRVFFP
mmetsp:Transcript_46216/g.91102  ORF Transcript_46216/g.91102 Transcript_46216/m.91102 type:complete len:202 (-) Transcript_46216:536-1141(-)